MLAVLNTFSTSDIINLWLTYQEAALSYVESINTCFFTFFHITALCKRVIHAFACNCSLQFPNETSAHLQLSSCVCNFCFFSDWLSDFSFNFWCWLSSSWCAWEWYYFYVPEGQRNSWICGFIVSLNNWKKLAIFTSKYIFWLFLSHSPPEIPTHVYYN
jgi:hypothetical protein